MIAVVQAWRGGWFRREHWGPNIIAGLIVGVVALPLAMAFAIASGVKPEQGLYTSIIAGVAVALFGGSRIQIAGPTGAFIVILAGVVAQFGVAGLMLATLMAGVILVLMGVARLGAVIRFIPDPVIVGFTAGIAVIIWVGQWQYFFGLPATTGEQFYAKGWQLLQSLPTLHPQTTALAAVSLVLAVWGPRIPGLSRVPGPLLAMLVATFATIIFAPPGVATIESTFGAIPRALPSLQWPAIGFDQVLLLLPSAFTIAMLGAIESLLSAVVADGMAGTRHDSNQELIGQGVANILSPLFGGIAATGAIARTATSIRNGGTSPIAGIVHAGVLLAVVWVAAPLAASIPLATLAAILMFVAWNMGEWRAFAHLRQLTLPYRVTLLSVFLLTVVFDLTVAVQFGIVAACVTFIVRIARLSRVQDCKPAALAGYGDAVQVQRFHGALFFGTTTLTEALQAALPSRVLVLDFEPVIYLDSTGADSLTALAQACRGRGVHLLACGLQGQPLDMARRSGLHALLESGLEPDLPRAVAAAQALLQGHD